jgi:hypothetical protein
MLARPEIPEGLGAQALRLAAKGLPVFPLRPGAKSPPLVSDWPVEATTVPAKIEAWWAQWPDANIGVHCAGMVVLDIDVKRDGYLSLLELELSEGLPPTYAVETPSGGRHLYYRGGPVSNRVAVWPGIDVRSERGYVVGAGSVINGKTYREIAAGSVARFPESVQLPSAGPPSNVVALRDAGTVDAVDRAIEWLRGQPPAPEGERNARGYAAACRCRDMGCSQDQTAESLLQNFRSNPPLDPSEIEHVARSAYRYARGAQGSYVPPEFEPIEPAPPPSALRHPADSSAIAVLACNYLVKGVLERGANALLFGHWSVGKTFVTLDLCAAIASGVPWFGRRVRAGKVLYLGYEGVVAMEKRMIALRQKYPALSDYATAFAWAPMRAPVLHEDGALVAEYLTLFAARYGGPPDLIVIDPLANSIGGDDSDADLIGRLNTLVSTLIQKQGCTVLRVHHTGHQEKSRARGSSMLPAAVDTEIRVSEGEITLTKQRDDTLSQFGFMLRSVVLGRDEDGDDVTSCTVDQVQENARSPELSDNQRAVFDVIRALAVHDVISKAKANKIDVRPRMTVYDAIKVLLVKRYLTEEGANYVINDRGAGAVFDPS